MVSCITKADLIKLSALFRISDILIRIRILGSVLWISDLDLDPDLLFLAVAFEMPTINEFYFPSFYCLFLTRYSYISLSALEMYVESINNLLTYLFVSYFSIVNLQLSMRYHLLSRDVNLVVVKKVHSLAGNNSYLWTYDLYGR
jgi:hypothetical protein